MSYDMDLYVGVDENGFDAPFVYAQVTWYPRGGGNPVTVQNDYLNSSCHYPILMCGMGEILRDLNIELRAGRYRADIVACINEQLERRPWAEIECPAGFARLDLVPVNAANTPSP